MSFRDVVAVIYVLGAIGVWVFVFWFSKTLAHLKSSFETMKISGEYYDTLVGSIQRAFDPALIDKVAKLRAEVDQAESKKKIEESNKNMDNAIKNTDEAIALAREATRVAQELSGYFHLALASNFLMSQQQNAQAMAALKNFMNPEALEALENRVAGWRESVQQQARAEVLARRSVGSLPQDEGSGRKE